MADFFDFKTLSVKQRFFRINGLTPCGNPHLMNLQWKKSKTSFPQKSFQSVLRSIVISALDYWNQFMKKCFATNFQNYTG